VSTGVAWDLLTDRDELATWLGSIAELDLRPGASAVVVETDGTVRHLVVDAVVAGERIGFTWWTSDAGPDEASHVELVIAEEPEGARVTVTELAPVRASVAGGVRRLAIGSNWSGRLVDLELRALTREPALV
jgi:uncharacterized protein YndB with AHSA1/START domain